jgi:integrase
VHLPSAAADLIAGMPRGADQDRICGTRPSILSRYVRETGLRALGRGVGCHELRRGFADLALDAGVDLLTVSRSLGHSDVRLLHNVYAGRREASVLAAGAAVGELLG